MPVSALPAPVVSPDAAASAFAFLLRTPAPPRPVAAAEPGTTSADPRLVVSLLADATSLDRAAEARLASALPAGVWVELCLAVRGGDAARADEAFDPRVRRLPIDPAGPRSIGARLGTLLGVATGSHLAPVFAEGHAVEAATLRRLRALPGFASVLGAADAPDALLGVADDGREAGAAAAAAAAAGPAAVRDRVERSFAEPLVIRRAWFDAVGGFEPGAGAAAPYALALALCRSDARLRDVPSDATPLGDLPPSLPEAARRVLGAHVGRTIGGDARLRPGAGWLSFCVTRRRDPRPAVTILWPGEDAPPTADWGPDDVVLSAHEAGPNLPGRIGTAFVLLLAIPSVPADPDGLATLVDRATDASVGAACAGGTGPDADRVADRVAGPDAAGVAALVVRRAVLLASGAADVAAGAERLGVGRAGERRVRALLDALPALGLRVVTDRRTRFRPL